uniref:Uncharacterized protein n=1 Tax=Rhizophora mucronata TaxID=61149 RepID=A0A2P2PGM1_RHIMU
MLQILHACLAQFNQEPPCCLSVTRYFSKILFCLYDTYILCGCVLIVGSSYM